MGGPLSSYCPSWVAHCLLTAPHRWFTVFSLPLSGEHSTIGGDIIRTVLVDDEANRATFDFAIDAARSGGFVTESWVHLTLSVDGSAVRTYVDGMPVRDRNERQ